MIELRRDDDLWVPVVDAARYADVSRSSVNAACRSGRVASRTEAGRRVVSLVDVLEALASRDVKELRSRIERSAAMRGVPPEAREWYEATAEVVLPILNRLLAAETRATLAEAKLDRVDPRGAQHQ